MDKIDAPKRKVRDYVCTVLALIALAAILVGVVVAFRSVRDVYFDAVTLVSSGGLVFLLLLVNYVVMDFCGRGDAISTIFVYTILLITEVAVIMCLHFGYAYAMPISFLPLILGTSFHKRCAFATHFTSISIAAVFLTLFAFYNESFAIHDIAMQVMVLVVNGATGTLLTHMIHRYASRFRILVTAGVIVLISGVIGFLSAAAMGNNPDVMQMITVGVSLIVGGAISIFAYFCLIPIFERVFNLNTGLRLTELCSFDQPLLKELEEKAPGTYNHSLTVANIAERAAYAVGEDPTLARAAALYHDIGKIENPEFFTENQTDGYNPHDELIPEVSVKMITRHTEAGAKILEAKGFPKEIISAAIQHHGDSSVGYFYHKAQNITEGTLEEKGYTYLGPKPQTKINAIIMIADIAEAATRSVRPSTLEELATLIDNLVRSKMNERQFDESPITMAELTKVKKAVVSTLMGVHHERISYTLDNKRK
ncbi:MAG: HDIG domain-containing protein [Clostridia bacterium]|nr:HDIG domain-containing protein [Clostridia bacterium]